MNSQCTLSEIQKMLLRSIAQGLKAGDGSVGTEWRVVFFSPADRFAVKNGLSDEIWNTIWAGKAKRSDIEQFVLCEFFRERDVGHYFLNEQAIVEAVDTDFANYQPRRLNNPTSGRTKSKLKYRHLPQAGKDLAVKLVQHYKEDKISRNFELTVVPGDDGILGAFALNDEIDISSDEIRLLNDLQGEGLLELGRLPKGNLSVTLTKSILDAVADDFSELEGGQVATEHEQGLDFSNRIFVVHGHDEEIKQAVARVLEKLGFDAIILHEQASKGLTIIEKLEDYSDVGFAVILLTPDDVGRSKIVSAEHERFRARQNVILELGFFLGRLERGRVFVLLREHETFEMPSDYLGNLYTKYDAEGNWRYELIRELKAANYDVDANALY